MRTTRSTGGRTRTLARALRSTGMSVPASGFTRVAASGFTLIELLVVTVIILMLAAITVPVIGGMLASARKAATTSTIKKVDELLKSRIAAFNRFIDEQTRDRKVGAIWSQQGPKTKQLIFTADPFITLGSPPRNYAKLAGSAGNYQETLRAMVLARKGFFRKYFPQNWDEVKRHGWGGQIGINPPTPSTSADFAAESGEVLYLMFTKLGFPGFEDDGSDVFLPSEVADTNNNGFPELVDAWGKPLRFYRWPTQTFRMAAGDTAYRADASAAALSLVSGYATKSTLAGAVNKDLDDPKRTIPSSGFSGVTPTAFSDIYHDISTFSLPLIVSPGIDGVLGLKEPGDASSPATKSGRLGFTFADATNAGLSAGSFDDILDNVTNLNITAGRTK